MLNRVRPAGLLLTALLAGMTLAGCVQEPEATAVAAPTRFLEESGRYAFQVDGTPIAWVDVHLTWGEPVMAELRIERIATDTPFGPQAAAAETYQVHIDPATGVQTRLEGVGGTHYPWGVEAHMPTAAQPLASALRGALATAALPLGPQWALSAPPTAGSDDRTSWGEITVARAPAADGWALTATGACQQDCIFSDLPQQEWRTSMRGDIGLLPAQVQLTMAGIATTFTMARTDHVTHGAPLPLEAVPPAPAAAGEAGPLCGDLLCESTSWPDGLSLRYGADALALHPGWQGWRADHPDAFVSHAAAYRDGAVVVLGTETVHLTTWGFRFIDPGGDTYFAALRAPHLPGGGLGPAVVESTQTGSSNHAWTWPDPEPAWLTLEAAVGGLAEAAQVAPDDITAITWDNHDPRQDPDVRAWSTLRIHWPGGGAGDNTASGSPADGHMQSMRMR